MARAAGSHTQWPDLHVDDPASIRNVVLVGPSGSGKTTLVEALAVTSGGLSRAGSVDEGTTLSDYEPAEHAQHRSVSLSVVPVMHSGVKINLLDTPGYADYVGEVRAGLRAADCALFVVSAADGIDGPTRLLWHECDAVDMPRCVVITRLDAPRADVAATMESCREHFGSGVFPIALPEHGRDGGVAGLRTLLDTADLDGDAADARSALLEGIIEESEDETLMDRYLAGETIDVDVLTADLEKAMARGSFFPAIPVGASSGIGTAELLDLMTAGFPSPMHHPMPPVSGVDGSPRSVSFDVEGPLVAEVVKTTSDPYVGRISVIRVFAGTAHPDRAVHVSGHASSFFGDQGGHADHDEDERVGAVSVPIGGDLQPVPLLVAGDVGAVSKLSRAESGDTISDKDHPVVMEPWRLPEPALPVAIEARSKADEDKLLPGLHRLSAEDPSIRVEQNPQTGQLVLWTMGEAHTAVLLERLERQHGAAVETVEVLVPLRETVAGHGVGHGRHVKQSGGHGQFAVCQIEVEPLPEGEGFEFVDKVVGGSVPRQFIPSVEKGVIAQMARGLSGPHPAVDLRVTLVDGKAHSVDSSDMAFQAAGGLALRDAAARAGVTILEPVDTVTITVDDDFVGAVMGDLPSRRARVVGTEQDRPGRTMVRAEAPQSEMLRYALELRSLSHGTGSLAREFLRYEPAPRDAGAPDH